MGESTQVRKKLTASWWNRRISPMRSFRWIFLVLFLLMTVLVGSFYRSRGVSLPSTAAALTSVFTGEHKIVKPEGFKIIAIVFYGRPDRVEILNCYLQKNLVENGGMLDEVRWAVNTHNEDDIKWLEEEVLPSSPNYKRVNIGSDNNAQYGKVWETVEKGHLYIKIDDDVVWLDDDAIPQLVDMRMKHPEAFLVSSNIINNPLLGWVHYRMGAVHPYWPELEPSAVPHADEWRASSQPSWDGPDGFAFGPHDEPPFDGHRWLPVSKSGNTAKVGLRDTPVGRIEYDAFGTGWSHWSIAAQEHASLFENLENGQLDLYKTQSKLWDFTGDRLSINFVAIWGDDIVNNSPIADDDEPALTVELPTKLNRTAIVASHSLISHYTFGKQNLLSTTNILARYSSYAHEKICKSSPLPRPAVRNKV